MIFVMELDEIRKKLETIIKDRGISMRTLSLRAGLQHNAVHNILYRNQKRINYQNVEKILNELGVPFADFWEPDESSLEPPTISPPADMHFSTVPAQNIMVPDCGNVSAGPFRLPDPSLTQRFHAGGSEDTQSFILTVSGDSMAPDYAPGEIIFLRKENIHLIALPNDVKVGVPFDRIRHLNGKDCVIFMNEEGSTFKRIRIVKGAGPEYTMFLLPVNPAHDQTMIKPEHDVWIQGVCYKSLRRR